MTNHYVRLRGDVLSQLKANDPSVEYLDVLWDECRQIDWNYAENKNSIGKNDRLKGLRFVGEKHWNRRVGLSGTRNFKAFCQGVAHNRSLTHLQLVCAPINASTVATLTALFQNNISFESLEINDCSTDDINRHHLASMLAHKANNLKRLVLRDLHDIPTALFISSLGAHPNLVTFVIGEQIGRESCNALGTLLENPKSKVRDLDIKNNRNLDDRCASFLGKALQRNNTLKSLDMDGCDSIGAAESIFASIQSPNSTLEKFSLDRSTNHDGTVEAMATALANNTTLKTLNLSHSRVVAGEWVSFFMRLQSSSFHLETLDLSYAKIDDGSIDILSNVLGTNTSLKKLDLQKNHSISSEGWQRLSTFLPYNSVLEMLDISQSENICDAVVSSFADALAGNSIYDGSAYAFANTLTKNSTLKTLNMSCIRVTAAGWLPFFARLQNTPFNLETLDLSYAMIDDEGIDILSNILATNATLKKLNLQKNHSISSEGWQRFSTFLRNNSVLEMLDVGWSGNICDAVVCSFADALAENSTLHRLEFGHGINEVGLMAFSQLLCNKTTIESTYSSNHTLNYIDGYFGSNSSQYQDFLWAEESNLNNNKYEVARAKILQHHFLNNDTDMNVQIFIDMELKVLPHAIAWLGMDQLGLAVLRKLLQKMPSELCSRDKAKAVSAERKRG